MWHSTFGQKFSLQPAETLCGGTVVSPSHTKLNFADMDDFIHISPRITLTPIVAADKENMIRYLNDESIGRNTLRVPQPYTAAHADERLEKLAQQRAETGTPSEWAIRHDEAGLIGGIGFFLKNGLDGHSDEIGYWLAAPFRGQGIMTEVVRSFADRMLEQRPALVRIEAHVFTQNLASVRLLEKAGFEREGLLRKFYVKNGAYIDVVAMARLR
jgi:[ribosomal protein S5]-alanine N-acetyltransferase